jgi:hypothetical protein
MSSSIKLLGRKGFLPAAELLFQKKTLKQTLK